LSDDDFDHLFVQPQSFDASRDFYVGTLGWQVLYDWGGDGGPRGACLGSGRMRLVLAEKHAAADHSQRDGVSGARPTLHLKVKDIEARHAELQPSGCVLFAPERTHWGSRWFVARDPDGNLIAFEQLDDD
jgi:catechol 2,3-dioxygenase-like lactoylglutathione lyase family enzyme